MSGEINSSGNNNINISGGKVEINGGLSQSYSDYSQYYDVHGNLRIEAERTSISRIPVRLNHVVFTGISVFIISMLTHFASLASFYTDSIPLWVVQVAKELAFPLMLLSGFFGAIGISFKLFRPSMGVSWFGNLETSSDGYVYFSKIRGICPICGGKMRMHGHSNAS
tara:strand:- start:8800 stop:9300 length:501 start_codon:yes stop_codon:yes gene_type:complete